MLILCNQDKVFGLNSNLSVSFSNPSYLLLHKPFLLVVEECEKGGLIILEANSGSIIDRFPIQWPCSINLAKYDPIGTLLGTANYSSSSIFLFRFKESKLVLVYSMKFDGSSVGKRQKSSHPHQVVFGGDVVYVPDLGMDCIHRIKIDIFKSTANLSTPTNTTTESNPNVTFSPLSPFKLPLGYGPRHLLITPPRIYLLAELVSHLIILDSLSGKLLEDVCLLDIDYDGASEIDEFQEFIFVSIRNTDGKGSKIRSESKECTDMESVQMNTNCSLSDTFNTNANDMGWIVSVNKKTFEKQINLLKGRLPRYFKIKDDLLYCLFQDQDFCQVFRIEGGLLIQVDVLTVGKGCSCLDFMVE